MGDAEKYIDEMHVYSSGTKGINLQMMSVADSFAIDFLQNFADRKYVEAFLTEASALGLIARCSEVIQYRTPKDHTENTNIFKSMVRFLRIDE